MSWPIHKVLEEGIQILSYSGKAEAALEARLLLEAVLECDRTYLMIHKLEEIRSDQWLHYQELIEERSKGKPIQHILKQQEFMGLKLRVTPFTLIPRRETEELVELALKHLNKDQTSMIMDIGTGTGCIPISLAVFNKKVAALGIDLSQEALEVAKENSRTHNVSDRITWIKSDLLESVDLQWHGKMDMVLSNPPYIKSSDIQQLLPEVRIFEPLMALDGGYDGLEFYRKICKKVKPYLKDGGSILFEIGYNQGKEVCELLDLNGFSQIECKKDLSGIDRMVYAVK